MRALSLLLTLLVAHVFAVEAQLPSGAALPPGMSTAEAASLAAQNGVTIGADGKPQLPPGMTADQAKGLARQHGAAVPEGKGSGDSKSSIPKSGKSSVDPKEGDVEVEVAPESRIGVANLRWGQRIFAQGDPSQAASHVGAIGPDYALGPGDELILTLWGQKEARYNLELDRDGQVAIELVGVVSLNGQTLRSAEGLLRKRLTKIYAGLADGTTQMDVTMGKLKQIRVYVLGDVERPGSYMLSGNTSVLAALFQARGPSYLGTERLIEVRRGNDVHKIDLYDYLARGRKPSRDILQDGDLIRIPRKGKIVSILGDVGRPGHYELLEREGAKDLLQYAGGVNASTAKTNVTVLRLFDNGRRDAVTLPSPERILAGENAALEDEDQVNVFAGADPSKASVMIEGEVRFPGVYPYTTGMTLDILVDMAGGLKSSAYAWRALVTRALPDGQSMVLRQDLSDSAKLELNALDRVRIANRLEFLNGETVTISGAVKRPGVFRWDSGMTVKDLILMAGGFQKDAEFGKLRLEIPVPGDSVSRVEWLELDSALRSGSGDRALTPRTHLAVPVDPTYNELKMVDVRGWVRRPGSYALLHPQERLSEVITRAGGFREGGYPDGARLLRGELGGGRIQIQFRKAMASPGGRDDLALRPGDVIDVPKQPATIEVRGRVTSPGHMVWVEGMPWKWYVQQAGGLADSAYEAGIYVEFADGMVETNDDGIRRKPNPGSAIVVPFRKPPEPVKLTDVLSGVNVILATVIAGLTIMVLLRQ